MEQSLKLKLLRKLLRKQGEEGFSLIELVVVVSVLAVLSAIAIPTFVCTTRKARATTALAALKQIQTECTVKKTNREDIASTFTTSNLQGYEIESDGGNSCDGKEGTGLIRAIPGEPDQLPTFILATNSNELTYSFKDQTGTNFQDCLSLICLQADSSGGGGTTTKNGVSIDQNGKPIILTDSDGNPEIMNYQIGFQFSDSSGYRGRNCVVHAGLVKEGDFPGDILIGNSYHSSTGTYKPALSQSEVNSYVAVYGANTNPQHAWAPDVDRCPLVRVPDDFFPEGPPTKPFEVKSAHYIGGTNLGRALISPRNIFDAEGNALMRVPSDPVLLERVKQMHPSIDWDTLTNGME